MKLHSIGGRLPCSTEEQCAACCRAISQGSLPDFEYIIGNKSENRSDIARKRKIIEGRVPVVVKEEVGCIWDVNLFNRQ